MRPGFVDVWFEGDEPSAAEMAQRLVSTLKVWVAALAAVLAELGPLTVSNGDSIEWELARRHGASGSAGRVSALRSGRASTVR